MGAITTIQLNPLIELHLTDWTDGDKLGLMGIVREWALIGLILPHSMVVLVGFYKHSRKGPDTTDQIILTISEQL